MLANPISLLFSIMGGPGVGFGHVRRSLALAELCRVKGINVAGFISNYDPQTVCLIENAGYKVTKAHSPYEISESIWTNLAKTSKSAILVDQPCDDDFPYKKVRFENPTAIIAALDYFDMKNDSLDLVVNLINHNPLHARPVSNHVQYREGVEYAIIRKEIKLYAKQPRIVSPNCQKILVSFGGSDPLNHTMMVMKAYADYADMNLEMKVIVGPHFENSRAVYNLANALSMKITSHDHVKNFGCALYESDLAFIGGGTTMIEAACVGTPAVVLPQNAGERHFATTFANRGAVLVAPEQSDEIVSMIKNTLRKLRDENIRRKMSEVGKRTIDGCGGERIIDALLSSLQSRKP